MLLSIGRNSTYVLLQRLLGMSIMVIAFIRIREALKDGYILIKYNNTIGLLFE